MVVVILVVPSLLAAALAGPTEASAEPGRAFALPCSWDPGYAVAYELARWRVDPSISGPRVVVRTPLSVRVLANEPPTVGYDLGFDSVDPEAAAEAYFASIGGRGDPLEKIVRFGGVVELVNLVEYVASLETGLRANAEIQEVDGVLAFYRSPAGMASLTKEPRDLFAALCATGFDGEVRAGSVPFEGADGASYITQSTLTTTVDPAAGSIRFDTTDTILAAEMARLMRGAVETVTPKKHRASTSRRIEAEVAQVGVPDLTVTSRRVYSLADGLPVHVRVERAIGAEGHPLYRVDVSEWTRAERPAVSEPPLPTDP